MMRWLVIATLVSCQPKQPLQPSYFTQKKPANAPLDCKETLDCYAACVPLVEECMLRCDERGSYYPVQRARAVANCTAQTGCAGDKECEQERCSGEIQACVDPAHAPQNSPMQEPPPTGTPPTPTGEPMPPTGMPPGEPMPPH